MAQALSVATLDGDQVDDLEAAVQGLVTLADIIHAALERQTAVRRSAELEQTDAS